MPLAVHTEDDGAHAEAVIRNGAAPAPSLLLTLRSYLHTTTSWSGRSLSLRPFAMARRGGLRTTRQRPGLLRLIAISEETEDGGSSQCPFSIGEEREDGNGGGARSNPLPTTCSTKYFYGGKLNHVQMW